MNKFFTKTILGIIIIGVISSFIYDLFKQLPILSTIGWFLNVVYDAAITTLNYPIRIWVILLLIFGLYGIYYGFKKSVKKIEPEWLQYKKDIFKTWIWKWEYKLDNNSGRYHIQNLAPYCPDDEVQLLSNGLSWNREFYCPKCNKTYPEKWKDSFEKEQDIFALIRSKIEKNNFPNPSIN